MRPVAAELSGAAGETLALSTGSLWLLAHLSQDDYWCPPLLLGALAVSLDLGAWGNRQDILAREGRV